MTAAALARVFGPRLAITVVESSEIGIVGVAAAMLHIVVALCGDGPPLAQRKQIVAQRIVLEGVRLIIIDARALLKGHVRMILIIGILLQINAFLVKSGFQFPRKRGFAASACAADADDKHDKPPHTSIPCVYDSIKKRQIQSKNRRVV